MLKLLILGGSSVHIPIIEKAKEMGHHVIVCDFNPNCPGRTIAHEFYNISVTNRTELLLLAMKKKIDGVVSYASDLTAETAAYLSEKLNFPTHPYKSVVILSNKEKFREFLREYHFNTPKAKAYNSLAEAQSEFHLFKLPVMIKPVDSSGSRGVSKIHSIHSLKEKVEWALEYSKVNRFLIEEYIESTRYFHIGGEGFSVNGELVFSYYFNEHFPTESPNPFVSIGASYPSFIPKRLKEKIDKEIQRVLDLLSMKTGAYNFEIRIDDEENVYLIEIAARNGVGYQNLLKYTANFDIEENIINAAVGNRIDFTVRPSDEFWAMYGIYSNKNGIFKGVDIDMRSKERRIVEYEMFVKPGDPVSALTGADKILGYMIYTLSSKSELLDDIENVNEWMNVLVEEI